MDIRKILDIVNEASKPLAKGMKVMSPAEFLQSQGIEPKKLDEFMDTGGFGGGGDGDDDYDEMKQRIIDMYFEDGLRELEIAKLEGISELEVHKIIDAHERGLDEGVSEDLDEAEKLKGVSQRPFPKDELIKYLDRVVGEPVLDKEGKPKLDKKGNPQFKSLKTKTDKYKFPYIHRSNVPIVNQDGQKYDLDKLASMFTERPSKILKQNEKMQHSDGTASQFYNVGLPALVGLAVDEDNNEFVVINTCPGAGNCKLVCYAMKGGYIQYPASNLSQTRLLNFLYNDPDGFMGMLENEIAGFEAKNSKKNIKTIIRWHDAGDFFSPEYLDKAYNLAKKFPDVDFYAYTKLASVAQGDKPDNFKINFSMGAQPSQEKKIDFAKTKNSRIVPEVIFADLLEKDKAGKWQYKNSQAEQAVKDRIAAKYSLDPKSIITYDEMMKKPVDKDPEAKGKWNVIVKPGDGDDAANRNDVLSSLLLIH